MDINAYRQETMGQSAVRQNAFINRVYAWMTAGLACTGIIAYFIGMQNPQTLSRLMPWMMPLLIVELVVVIALSWGINRLSAAAATVLFFFYAGLNGVTLSVIFLAYELGSIAKVFFITTATFGAMSAIGYTTKRDLSGLGSFLFMGLIGLIIAGIINAFWYSSQADLVISFIGVLLFVGLTAYDTQKIKRMASACDEGEVDAEIVGKSSIIGALQLYLDFINLFLYLLRLMGRRR